MTEIEIDKALALAIGWPSYCVVSHRTDGVQIWVQKESAPYDWGWRAFSHKDWATIGPIAERYNMFPYKLRGIECHAGWNVLSSGKDFTDISPQRAIALAVIQGAKK